MNPLIVLLIGLAIVLGGILWLRLHPFLSLILGAFAVGMLTGDDDLKKAMQAKYHGDLIQTTIQNELVTQAKELEGTGQPFNASELRLQAREIALRQDDRLEAVALEKAEDFVKNNSVVERITAGIGSTCQKIGLLIAMACIISRCLLASGSAERIVRGALAVVGQRGVPVAFLASSFVLSIPVFFDSVFLLVIPLAKATWLKLRKNYLLFMLALVTGGTMTHSLVPPTPGPLFVAEELGVNIGLMMLVGMVIGLCCAMVGLLFAYWVNARLEIPVRDSPEALEKLQVLSNKQLSELPPMWLALAPVLLPVFLISGATIYGSQLLPTQSVPQFMEMLCNSNTALSISAAIAMIVAAIYLQSTQAFGEQLQQAMQEAGLIVLVCCAGGAFGATLQQSGIGPYIRSMIGSEPLDFTLLPLAFLVTAVIRGAQGSSTVAMLTAVEIVRSLAPDTSILSYHPVYLAVAIGCGSKPFPWMNDSGFWVICKTSGLTEQEMLRTHTPMVTWMGFSGILVTMIGAKLLPLIG